MKEAEVYKVNAFRDPISNFLFSKWQHFFVILLIFFSLQIIVSIHSGTLIKIDFSLVPQLLSVAENSHPPAVGHQGSASPPRTRAGTGGPGPVPVHHHATPGSQGSNLP